MGSFHAHESDSNEMVVLLGPPSSFTSWSTCHRRCTSLAFARGYDRRDLSLSILFGDLRRRGSEAVHGLLTMGRNFFYRADLLIIPEVLIHTQSRYWWVDHGVLGIPSSYKGKARPNVDVLVKPPNDISWYTPGADDKDERLPRRADISANPSDVNSVGFQAISTDEEAANSTRFGSERDKSPFRRGEAAEAEIDQLAGEVTRRLE
ncbi:hypothetical protein TanjilG_10899 [Lupinus angustifolius]|uniref:Uncharacterized protein n=1 Tax=Lupinus angustifolius TaxID=3871 RepID=A0A1J7G424_LUPAN|nr:hypothetical protein TanjilG_10899 [Lupinus angustifolius]